VKRETVELSQPRSPNLNPTGCTLLGGIKDGLDQIRADR
jgi:hypothetical protein